MVLPAKTDIRKINKEALAEKHGCSPQHVGRILTGKRRASNDRAKAIIEDANKIIGILKGDNAKKQTADV